MSGYHIKLTGPFKPYVRMTQRGKWVKPEAKAYLASKQRLQFQLYSEMVDRPMMPGQAPLAVFLVISHSGGFHNRDLDNEIKALLDAMNGIVYPDDRWIDEIRASRVEGDRDAIHVYVEQKGDRHNGRG